MLQEATVLHIIDPNTALISVARASACGHDCSSCAGCGMQAEPIEVDAQNLAKAKAGDRVMVETGSKAVLGIAFVVYVVPIVLFFLCYAIMAALGAGEGLRIGIGIAGFFAGILGAWLLNRRMKSSGGVTFKIIKIISGESGCLDM